MKMTLYSSKTSPYSRKVRAVIEELELGHAVEEVAADPFNPPTELLAANPLSRIPTLITDKGEALPDSRLIIEYLQARSGKALAPLPRGPARWAALRRLEIAEGIMDAAVASVLEKRRPESIVYTAFLDRQAAVIRRCVETLNLEAGALATEAPGEGDITAAVALAYLDFRLPYLEWRKDHDALAAWFIQFAQRPCMVKTQPPV